MRCEVYHRVAAEEPDEYGNVVYNDELIAGFGCFLVPVTQQEIQLGRAEVGSALLVLPAEAADVANAFARYVIDGVSYEGEGAAAAPHSLLNTGVHHVEVRVVRSSA